MPLECQDVNNFLETEANRISSQTARKNWAASPWDSNQIVPKTTWEDGMGESPNFLIFDRVTPLNGPMTFYTVSFNNDDTTGGGTCVPPVVTITESTRRLSMQLKKGALESRRFCIEDGRMSWNIAVQAENVLRQMKSNITYAWANQRRDEFTRIATNKAIADASMTTNPTSFGTGTIGQLVRGHLDYWYDRLVNDGADADNGMIEDEYGQPVFPLILSREAQFTLTQDGVTIQNLRWDDNKVGRLNGPRGSFTNLNGFKMAIDNQAPRWNLVNGTWTRVPFYSTITVAGEASSVNPDYYTAEYEDLFIASTQVLKFAIPSAALNAGPMKFPAQDYMGNVRWINKFDLQCNVDENIGFFRAVIGYGAQPVIPEYGVVLRFKRCPMSWTTDATCS
jgi:hypothetical protein